MIRLVIERIQGDTRRLTFEHMGEIEDLIVNRPPGAIVHLPQHLLARKVKNSFIIQRNRS
jgi:hypothetical protein